MKNLIADKALPKGVSLTYDRDARALYLQLTRAQVAWTRELDELVHVDFDRGGRVVGFEVIQP